MSVSLFIFTDDLINGPNLQKDHKQIQNDSWEKVGEDDGDDEREIWTRRNKESTETQKHPKKLKPKIKMTKNKYNI